MQKPLLPGFLGLTLTAFLLGGCGTTSTLHIAPSRAPDWTFSPPPPSYLRLPIKLSIPKVRTVGRALTGLVHKKEKSPDEETTSQKKGWLSYLPIPHLTDLWNAVQEPIYIDKGIWLMMRPEWFSTGIDLHHSINPLKKNLVLEMKAYPTLIFGDKPQLKKKLLPPIHLYKSGPSGFHTTGDTFISFKEANRILCDPKNKLVGHVIPGSGDYKLRIKAIKLYGSGGQIVAQTKVEYNRPLNIDAKPIKMTIYFRGVPKFDTKRKEFRFQHLDFDVKTGDFLTQVAVWIFKSDILKDLRKHARIPIGPKMEKLKDRMNEVLNRPVGNLSRLETNVESFKFAEAYVDKDGIKAQLSLSGTATLRLLGR